MSVSFNSKGDFVAEALNIATSGEWVELLRLPADNRKGFSVAYSYTGGPQEKIRLMGYANVGSTKGVVLAVSDGTAEDFATASDLIMASFPAEPSGLAAETNGLLCLGSINLAEMGIEVWVTAAAVYSAEVHEVNEPR